MWRGTFNILFECRIVQLSDCLIVGLLNLLDSCISIRAVSSFILYLKSSIIDYRAHNAFEPTTLASAAATIKSSANDDQFAVAAVTNYTRIQPQPRS